jgi:hypothetical protein
VWDGSNDAGGNPTGEEWTPDQGTDDDVTTDQTDDADTSTDEGTDDDVATGTTLTGWILSPGATKFAPRAQEQEDRYTVIAQSKETGTTYRAETDGDGQFALELSEDQEGNSFMVTILGPDGRAVGPVLFGESDGEGLTGLAPEGETSLGTIELPEDPTTTPIEPGPDGDAADFVDPSLTARLDDNGVPVGLASHGKGQDAQREDGGVQQAVDGDQDGLIDVFDADDDGDGVVDDFDGNGDVGGIPDDLIVNFFMNLKIGAENASAYYEGTESELEAALGVGTGITFEVMTGPGAVRTITGAHLLKSPAPSYLPDADMMTDGQVELWTDSGYAFSDSDDRFEAFVRPNAVMDAGDTFTVEVEFDDDTTGQYSRMINYVFKNIPKLVQYGSPGALQNFDISNPGENGTPNQPIHFDGTQDLVLVFNPPPDETGAYLTALDYSFQLFYHATDDGSQLNGEIDVEATWPTPPSGFQRTTYWVDAEDLALSADDTYTATLPAELFPDTVHTLAGVDEAVWYYKIDITAESPSGNAAIMLAFVKD